jgi:2-methylcitrate dehydratase PrpD
MKTVSKPSESAATEIARWASGLSREDIPEPILAIARSCLTDTIGVALAGTATPVAGIARTVAAVGAGAGLSSLLAQGRTVAAPAAAFVNGTAAHALDFDDNCYAGVVHGSAVIVPAALAAAELADIAGVDLLTAIVAGSEAEYAVGAAAGLSLYDRGWWTTGLLGPIGASVAAGRATGLDAARMAHAIAIAMAGTGGAKACFGTDAKPLLCGRAAEAGMVAVLLAQHGATGPLDVLEHLRGFAGLMNGGVFAAGEIGRLGRRWRLETPGIDVKRMPVCLSSHAAVDAAADLVAEHGLSLDAILRITCDVPPIVVANLVHDTPRTSQQAQFSMPFAIAASLVYGEIGLAHLRPEVVTDPAVVDMMRRVDMCTGARWADLQARVETPEGAHVSIDLADGRRYDRFRGFARGSAAFPLSASALDAKFMACAAPAIGEPAAVALLDRLHHIDRLPSVRSLFGADG